jgi:hypothetical protein
LLSELVVVVEGAGELALSEEVVAAVEPPFDEASGLLELLLLPLPGFEALA